MVAVTLELYSEFQHAAVLAIAGKPISLVQEPFRHQWLTSSFCVFHESGKVCADTAQKIKKKKKRERIVEEYRPDFLGE